MKRENEDFVDMINRMIDEIKQATGKNMADFIIDYNKFIVNNELEKGYESFERYYNLKVQVDGV